MDKKSVAAAAPEPSKEPAKDPLADAKRAFDEALQKTNDGLKASGDEEKVVVEAVGRKPKVETKAKAEPKPVEKPNAELEALKKQIADLSAKLVEREKPVEPVKQKATDFDSVQAELAEQFGEEEGEILSRALKALIAPREERISNLEGMIQKAIEKSNKSTSKSNRARLSKEYAHLADSDDAWGIVESQAKSLIASGKHDSPDEAFDAVVLALYGKAQAKAQEDAEEEASRIAASTPTQPSSARRERKLTNEQKSRAIFDHLLKNPEDAAGAKRLARELRVES